MCHVFVLDTNKQPLAPVYAGWARILLRRGKAAVFPRYPFTIILKEALPAPQVQELHLKIDPGSKTSGLAIVDDVSGKSCGQRNPPIGERPLRRHMTGVDGCAA